MEYIEKRNEVLIKCLMGAEKGVTLEIKFLFRTRDVFRTPATHLWWSLFCKNVSRLKPVNIKYHLRDLERLLGLSALIYMYRLATYLLHIYMSTYLYICYILATYLCVCMCVCMCVCVWVCVCVCVCVYVV